MEEFKQVWLNNNVLKPGKPLQSFQFYKDKMFFPPTHICIQLFFWLAVIQKCNMNQVSQFSIFTSNAILLCVCIVWDISRLYS